MTKKTICPIIAVKYHVDLVDCLYLAQRELREFYTPSQSVALTVINDTIKRLESEK